MELKDSRTKENLMRAFVGESQARNRYTIGGELAKKEGLYIVQQAFDYTADQERAHAKVYIDALKEFTGQNIGVGPAEYPIEVYDTTLEALKAAQHDEYQEWESVYKEFAEVAKEEGFPLIASHFTKISEVEKVHGDRFGRLATELANGALFKKETEVKWMCTNCGFIYEGKEAPKVCPVCSYPQGYYILFAQSLFE
ncbi:rubrerythrin [Clostridium chauvoei]|uniref:Rubrerythrin family protein n=2 Tax=Clostridium chauvoei TaxID=46867 RepID=A0ABD4RGH7_9CLOT|nr:rubrerythrin family protein [Clostridium chauvoei]ATD54669.1 rubrerythrin family protein [Clostridium chauvoei]ATD57649.1 rubrerythrin family protein [Clostridium chauvoei]MBX7279965.1 rubrerythrin family protein [Clostridium chauvoei]MBX7282376.1 rubrerythrin family protein [Clostridium chauvoei]MBX7284856.1 rubrerythrin family protein [Clostridium chauvoei]